MSRCPGALRCVCSKLCSLTLDEHTQCGHVNLCLPSTICSFPSSFSLHFPDVAEFPDAAFLVIPILPWYSNSNAYLVSDSNAYPGNCNSLRHLPPGRCSRVKPRPCCRAIVTAVSPELVSDWGGIVTISGSGFGNERQRVKVILKRPDSPDPHECAMLPGLAFSSTSLQCVAPPASWTAGTVSTLQLEVVVVVSDDAGGVNSECTQSTGCATIRPGQICIFCIFIPLPLSSEYIGYRMHLEVVGILGPS